MTVCDLQELLKLKSEFDKNLKILKKAVEESKIEEIHEPMLNLCISMYHKLLILNEQISLNSLNIISPTETSISKKSFLQQLDDIMLKAYRMRCADIIQAPLDWFNINSDPRRPFPTNSQFSLTNFGNLSANESIRMKYKFISPCNSCQKLQQKYKLNSPSKLKSKLNKLNLLQEKQNIEQNSYLNSDSDLELNLQVSNEHNFQQSNIEYNEPITPMPSPNISSDVEEFKYSNFTSINSPINSQDNLSNVTKINNYDNFNSINDDMIDKTDLMTSSDSSSIS